MSATSSSATREGRRVRRIAVLVHEGITPLELATFHQLFQAPGTGSNALFDVVFTSASPRLSIEFLDSNILVPLVELAALAEADLAFLTSPRTPGLAPGHPELGEAVRALLDQGGQLMALGAGVIDAARAGVLEGRRAAADRHSASLIAREHPGVCLVPNVVYVEDDPVYTAVGGAGTIDACLRVICRTVGAAAATALADHLFDGDVARRRDDPTYRPATSIRHREQIAQVQAWALAHLDQDLSVEALARRACMSGRSFARAFRDATGLPPYKWVMEQRLQLAQRLLESDPQATVKEIAAATGVGTSSVLRQQFRDKVGCTPSEYRSRVRLLELH